MPPVQADAQTAYRYQRVIERIAQVQSQMRSLRNQIQQFMALMKNNLSLVQDVKSLPDGDYVFPLSDSPKKEEILEVLRGILSYIHYAGYITLQEYQAIMGEDPVPPDQISAKVDAWVRD